MISRSDVAEFLVRQIKDETIFVKRLFWSTDRRTSGRFATELWSCAVGARWPTSRAGRRPWRKWWPSHGRQRAAAGQTPRADQGRAVSTTDRKLLSKLLADAPRNWGKWGPTTKSAP